MDTLSHGLWGAAPFTLQGKRPWRTGLILGMAPDLLSFGPFFVTRLGPIATQWKTGRMEPPDPATIPAYVYTAYDVTHSLIVWALVFALLWAWKKRPVWLWGAWGLHILCDIPTHTTRFFPTPFLWPFPTPYVDGISWGHGHFTSYNYLTLTVVYMLLLWSRSRRTSKA